MGHGSVAVFANKNKRRMIKTRIERENDLILEMKEKIKTLEKPFFSSKSLQRQKLEREVAHTVPLKGWL